MAPPYMLPLHALRGVSMTRAADPLRVALLGVDGGGRVELVARAGGCELLAKHCDTPEGMHMGTTASAASSSSCQPSSFRMSCKQLSIEKKSASSPAAAPSEGKSATAAAAAAGVAAAASTGAGIAAAKVRAAATGTSLSCAAAAAGAAIGVGAAAEKIGTGGTLRRGLAGVVIVSPSEEDIGRTRGAAAS